MRVKLAQAGEGGGCTPTPFQSFIITSKVAVYAPAEWVDTVHYNYLLTYDSYGPVHNRFHRGECITWASGGEGTLDTPRPLNGIKRSECHLMFVSRVQGHNQHYAPVPPPHPTTGA